MNGTMTTLENGESSHQEMMGQRRSEAALTTAVASTFAKRRGHSMRWSKVNMTALSSRGLFCWKPKKESSDASDAASSTPAETSAAVADNDHYDRTVILNNVSGSAPSGHVTAIMGESGSGKTSLLNVLSGRVKSVRNKLAVSSESLLLDGRQVDPANDMATRQRIAFCEQQDSLPVTATPREAIMFSARMRLPKTVTDEDLQDLTTVMLEELHLKACANVVVGGTLVKGLSGGEKKRTTMGVELVTRPNLLFADEPTSGLDSFNALEVCHVLKKIARAGSAVLVTIHQPSSDIYTKLIDRLILLKQGQVMYSGPANHVIQYFGRCGYPCPPHHNPADWIITVAQTKSKQQLRANGFFQEQEDDEYDHQANNNNKSNKLQIQSRTGADPPGQYWVPIGTPALVHHLTSPVRDEEEEEKEEDQNDDKPSPTPQTTKQEKSLRIFESMGGSSDDYTPPQGTSSNNAVIPRVTDNVDQVGFLTQVTHLFIREIRGLVRNKKNITTRAGMTCSIGLLGGCIFLNVAESDFSEFINVQTAFGALLIALLSNVFSVALPSLVAFPEERPVFIREYSTNHYSVTAYFISRFSIELFVTGMQVTVSSMLTYTMIGFTQGFSGFWACLYAFAMSSTSLAVLIGCSVKDPDMAIELLPLALMPQILFAGFFAPPGLIPPWLSWLSYVFPLTYAVRIVLVNEFDGRCDDAGGLANFCEFVLENVEADPDEMWWYWTILIGECVLFRFLALFILREKGKSFY